MLLAIQTTLSAVLYLEAKDLLPGRPESMYEIGYILFKRPSIFGISAIVIVNSFGLLIIYFIVFGDTLKSLVRDMSHSKIDGDDFMGKRAIYVIMLTLLLVPVILQK